MARVKVHFALYVQLLELRSPAILSLCLGLPPPGRGGDVPIFTLTTLLLSRYGAESASDYSHAHAQ